LEVGIQIVQYLAESYGIKILVLNSFMKKPQSKDLMSEMFE